MVKMCNFAVGMEKESHVFRKLFLTFAKIGAFTFGGGWAMIAIMEREIVDKRHWLTKEEFLDQLAVAQAMPGILAVNISVAVGDKIAGTRGTMVSALGTILPSFFMILAIAIFLTPDMIKENETVSKIFQGIRPAVVALILAPLVTNWKRAGITWKTAIIPIGAALLIWSKWPIVSNPIIYILLGIAGGWFCFGRRGDKQRKEEEAEK